MGGDVVDADGCGSDDDGGWEEEVVVVLAEEVGASCTLCTLGLLLLWLTGGCCRTARCAARLLQLNGRPTTQKQKRLNPLIPMGD